MDKHISQFLDAVNTSKVSECVRLSSFEGFSQKDLVESTNLLNTSLIAALKENLHNFKGKYIYDFAVGAISKATGISIFFNPSADILLQVDEQIAIIPEESEKAVLPAPLHIDMFLLSVSHLTSLMQQKITSTEQKSLVGSILKIISLFSNQQEIQNISRRQKFLQTFLKLFSEFLMASQPNELITADESHLVVLSTHIIAKMLLNNKKNQEYLIRKKAHELFKPVLLASDKNTLIYSACAGILINLASTIEGRQLLRQSGVAGIAKTSLLSNSSSLKLVEINYLLISRIAHDSKDIVEDLIKDGNTTGSFQESLNQILAIQDFQDISFQKNENVIIYGLVLSIIRRIAAFSDHRNNCVKKYLKFPLNYLNKNQEIVKPSQPSAPSEVTQIYAYKEALQIIGLLLSEEEARQQVLKIQPKIVQTIIKLAKRHFKDQKLVKFALMCLTNLSVLDSVRYELSLDNEFYSLLHQTIDTYDHSPELIVICLKLMLNYCSNVSNLDNFSQPNTLVKLLFLGFAYNKHVMVVDLTNKLIKVLCVNSVVLGNIVKCYRAYEESNQSYKFSTILVTQLKLLLSNGIPESVFELLQLLASFCIVDKQLVEDLKDKTDFLSVVKDIIDQKRQSKSDRDQFLQNLAQFPLEDMKGLLSL